MSGEYWIVNPMTETVQVYSFEDTEDSTQFSFDDSIASGIYDGFCDLHQRIAEVIQSPAPQRAGEQLNNVFTKATGKDSFPSVPESYGRGGVYEYLRRIHDSFDSMQFTYSDSDFYA